MGLETEFNHHATVTPDMLRRLGRRAVIEAAATSTAARQRADERRERERSDDLFMTLAEIAAAVYRETQERVLTMLAIDAEATRLALQEIEQLIAQKEAERQAMLHQAVKLNDGTAVFLTEDGSAIYTEHGDRLTEDAFDALIESHGDDLRTRWRWDAVLDNQRSQDDLIAEQATLEQHAERTEELLVEVESGAMTLDEMEALEADYEADRPERVLHHRPAAEAAQRDNGAGDVDHQDDQPSLSSLFNDRSDPVPPESATAPTASPMMQRPAVPGPAP